MLRHIEVVLRPKFLEEIPKYLVNEVTPSITYHHPRFFELREDDLMEHTSGMLGISSSAGYRL